VHEGQGAGLGRVGTQVRREKGGVDSRAEFKGASPLAHTEMGGERGKKACKKKRFSTKIKTTRWNVY